MLKKIIPLVVVLVAAAGGMAAGKFLRPPPEVAEGEDGHGAEETHAAEPDPESMPEYVKLNNQFVVPVLQEGRIRSLVILSLSLEVAPGTTEQVYAREPKLRDGFLRILFDHANTGGFSGTFTDGANLVMLRAALLESAQRVIGQTVTDVLISDMARQDS